MTLVALNGSHSASSSTHAVATLAAELYGSGEIVDLVTLDPAGLIGTTPTPDVAALLQAIEEASILVLVTPIYRATYSGLLKVVFDQLPAGGLKGKAAVLAATAGGPAHYLALDTGMRSLVASLDGWTVPTDHVRHAGRLRRAEGPVGERAGVAGRGAGRGPVGPAMSARTMPSVDEFAAGAAEWLAAHRAEAPPDYGAICPPELVDAGVALAAAARTTSGYAGIHWPVEHGGQGLTPEHQAAWLIECAKAGVPPVLNMVGLVLAGGAILRYGTPEQQAQHLRADAARRPGVVPAVLASRAPAATSAGCRRKAERDGDHFVVNGQKVWCSRRAHQRLGHPHGPHRTRRPPSTTASRSSCARWTCRASRSARCKQMTGGAEFDEVFFTDVELPADRLLGPLHGGWGVGMSVLTNERGHIGTAIISLERRLESVQPRSAPSASSAPSQRQRAGRARSATRQRRTRRWPSASATRAAPSPRPAARC